MTPLVNRPVRIGLMCLFVLSGARDLPPRKRPPATFRSRCLALPFASSEKQLSEDEVWARPICHQLCAAPWLSTTSACRVLFEPRHVTVPHFQADDVAAPVVQLLAPHLFKVSFGECF